MLRKHNDKVRQKTIWESMLPKELFELDEELKKVDEFLDDDAFMQPFVDRFSTTTGRPTIPVETFLRIMYLKHRHNLSYESVVKEISDSIKWRTFCRLQLDDPVPDYTTLIKSVKRYSDEVLTEINELLIQKAREKKIMRSRRLRVDTTIVEADIHYPTDAGLLGDGIRSLSRTVKKLRKAGNQSASVFRDRTRSVKKRLFSLNQALRQKGEKKKEQVKKITTELVSIAKEVMASAREVCDKLGEECNRIIKKAEHQIEILEQIVQQTETVLCGNTSIPNRIVSFYDTEARPIKKGRLGKPVEFGRKICIAETGEGLISSYELYNGNPSDSDLLIPAVEKHKRLVSKAPRAVVADGTFGSKNNETALLELGVKSIGLCARGRRSVTRVEHEKQPWFKRLKRFRAGIESTISVLKRSFGLNRSRYKGTAGNRQWVGLSIMSYNLRKIAQLM